MLVLPLILVLGATLADDYSVVSVGQSQALLVEQAQLPETRELRWSQERLQCRYNPKGALLPLATVEAAIIAAGRAWELKSGLVFEYAGTTAETPGRIVRDCLISWDTFSNPFKLGQAQNFRVDTDIVGSDIRISQLIDEQRLLMVLTHEIGHGLGLRHDEEGCIMRPAPSGSALCFSDYAGVSYLYPPYKVDGRPALDCSANLSTNNELYIPSIDGKYWARYRLGAKLNLTYIEHGEIAADDFFLCK